MADVIPLDYTQLRVVEGCRDHRLGASQILKVIEARRLGPDFGTFVAVKVETSTGQQHSFQVRHADKLRNDNFNAHKGDPTRRVKLAPIRSV